MSEESKSPKMQSSGDSKKPTSSDDVKEKQGASDSSGGKSSGADDKAGDKSGKDNTEPSGQGSKGGAESSANANEKGGSGGKSSGLAVGDDAGKGLSGAMGVINDDKSKGGFEAKADADDKSQGVLGGKSGGKKNKSLGQKLKGFAAKASMMAHAALTALKTLFTLQLLAMLQALLAAIAAAVSAAISAVVSVITAIVTTIATVVGVSIAAAAVMAIGGIVGVIVAAVVVVGGIVISNNTAVKDDVPRCEEVDMQYMEIPDGIPPEAWTNAKLIYTFYKSYGNAAMAKGGGADAEYTDEMIAGILGNWYSESKIDSTAVETIFDEEYAIGPKKLFLWQGGVYIRQIWKYSSVIGWYYSKTEINPYYLLDDGTRVEDVGFLMHTVDGVETDCYYIYDEDDDRGYGVSRYVSKTYSPLMFEVKWFKDVYQTSYWTSFPAIQYVGLGLGQWTNTRNTGLIEYADEKSRNWYDVDLQLMYALTESAGSFFKTWVGARNLGSYTSLEGTTYTDGMLYDGEPMLSAAEIAADTEKFFVDWEAGGEDNARASGSADERINNALMWYNIITEWEEDIDYVLGTGSSLWNTLAAAAHIASDVNESSQARECNELTFMGNSSLAEAMVSYAWGPLQDDHNDGTKCWQHLHNTLAPGDQWKRSCDRTVCIGVWWSGTDSSYLLGSTKEQLNYLNAKDASYRAMLAAGTTAGMTSDTAWWMKVDTSGATTIDEFMALLEPGDVLIRNDEVTLGYRDVGHTLCYVGSETVQRRWPDADPKYCIVSGSLNQRSPGTGVFTYGTGGSSDYMTYFVFRNMKTYCADDARGKIAVTCAGHSNDE